jgi:hypothetical protein
MPEKRTLILTPDKVAIALLPEQDAVLLRLDMGNWDQFLEHDLAIRMSPIEARRIARALTKAADAAES